LGIVYPPGYAYHDTLTHKEFLECAEQ
jgi:hypothetical protein